CPSLSLEDDKALHPSVYEPREDTFLMLDTLLYDKQLLGSLKPFICIEIGYVIIFLFILFVRPGSGCVTAYLAELLHNLEIKPLFFGVDINIEATLCTRRTVQMLPHIIPVIARNVIDCYRNLNWYYQILDHLFVDGFTTMLMF